MIARLRSDLREMVREQVAYRDLLFSITWRDLLLRYKQTVMGFGWAVFMPVMNMLIFSVIFTRVARVETGMPYPLFVYAGLLPWNLFSASVRAAATSLTGNGELVTKIYFPREVFPFSAILVAFADFVVASTVMAGLMVYYGVGVTWALLFLPVVVLVLLTFTAGVALILALSNLFYRDVKYLFEVVITVWMFATSVVYPLEGIGGTLGAALRLNPMTPIIDAFRAVVLRGELPPAGPFLYATAVSITLLVSGWVMFHRAEFSFAENL